ncbi:DUF2240 family protein [Palaeococcus ferrophilus]|uniref:DUF2240 family protein n=1 Tax=Palaeococcus ferrophilus TaxID=83868 RepID=UPI00064ECE94|nr:DUF2240 family protein [Palaeococcus ferrophilus]
MEVLKDAVTLKGSNEFQKRELVAILSFRLKAMTPAEAKELIAKAVEKGVIEERDDLLVVHAERAEGPVDVFDEMVEHIARSLGWSAEDVLEELEEFSKRYGALDRKLVLYLLGVEKGVDMSGFKERLD